ncbi:MAG TPA: hypothetical protein VFD33_07490 [Bacillota bacterium]|nr:hypothetical protein [Bacillota bacterium]
MKDKNKGKTKRNKRHNPAFDNDQLGENETGYFKEEYKAKTKKTKH